MTAFDQLNQRLRDVHNLNAAYWLLQWDQNTYLPEGGAQARGEHLAVLSKLRHEMLTSDETIRLLEAAEQEVDTSDFDSVPASLVRVARRDIEHASALPASFVAEYTAATADGFEAWKKARAASDYALFLPALCHIFELKMEEVEYRGHDGHPYDVFLDNWERGLTTKQVRQIFDAQRDALIELTAAVNANQDAVDDSLLHQHFDIPRQRELCLQASTAFGFDYDHWARMDVAPHPFCTQIARRDIRLTTRFEEGFFNPGFYGTLHETGHGLHGAGFAPELDGSFLSDMESYSQAVCESQSRTWENLVGRSRAYWEWAIGPAKAMFPEQFADATPESVYKAVNKARPQFIRVEADELTYNLHIMLRFDVELAMVEGRVPLEDLPDLWNSTFEAYFGITPPDDAQGILQDIHWSMGGIGAFVGYALGNLLSVQYFNAMRQVHPNIDDEFSRGEFDTLHQWLIDNIYQHGRKYTADELTRRITGEGIQSGPYVAYLTEKFKDVYRL